MMRYCLILLFVLLLIMKPLYGQFALEFDGVDDFAEVPHNSILEFTDQITVEIWFLVENIPGGDHRLFNKKVQGIYDTFTIFFRGNSLRAAIAEIGMLIIPGSDIPIDVWNHAAFTYDGEMERLYLNGSLMDSLSATGDIPNESTPVSFGRYDGGFGQYFDGLLDEARLWKIARTGDEIRSTMNAELSGFEEGLVGYWKFNEGVGDSIFDSTPNENDGQLGPDPSDPTWITRAFPPPTPVDLIIKSHRSDSNTPWRDP